MMGTFLQDLRYGLRMLARNPAFAVAATVVLALGIGANTALFSLVHAVVLKPLPGVARPAELVDLTGGTVSYPWYRSVRESATAFDGLAAWRQRELALSSGGVAERVVGGVVSGNYFQVLGAVPSRGRLLLPADEESGEAVAVIGEKLWKTRLGSDPAVVGKTIRINDAPFTVVGVAAEGFRGTAFGVAPDLWVPIGSWPRLATGRFASLDLHGRGWSWLSLFGRRKPGVSAAQVQSGVDALVEQQHAAFPNDAPDDLRLRVRATLADAAGFGESGNPVGFLAMLSAAVGVALAIACANLGNLLLARAEARRREIAVRRALGASRSRLVRQLLTESVVLALLGGGAGLVVAGWALSLAERLPLPGGASFETFAPVLDLAAFGFAFLLSVATGLAFGLLPALQASRASLGAVLKDADAVGRHRSVLRSTLVAAQVSLCLVLLVGAGLLGRSLQRALAVDLGFSPKSLVVASVNPGLQRYDAARAETFLRELPRRVAASPGIRGASWMSLVPLSGGESVETFAIEGRPAPPGRPLEAEVNALGGGFFRVMGIPVASGREFDDDVDRRDSGAVVMINEAMARKYWPGQNPLGARIDVGGPRTVIGVSGDFRTASFSEPPVPQIYLPLSQTVAQSGLGNLTLVTRVASPAIDPAAAVRSEVRRLDASMPVYGIRSLETELAGLLLAQRLGSALLGLFGVLSLVLAAVGIYAVVSYSVARRTREIGIRMALGARAGEVSALVLSQNAFPIVAGLTLGLALGAAAARLLREFLYGISPFDFPTFAAVSLILAACGAAAAWLPARRAASVDPMTALRSD
jgi:predicted permease